MFNIERARSTEPSGGNGADLDRRGALSLRGREVARLVARGRSNRQIAEELVISERTAEGHVEHIHDKLGVRNRAEVAVWVVQNGAATLFRPVGHMELELIRESGYQAFPPRIDLEERLAIDGTRGQWRNSVARVWLLEHLVAPFDRLRQARYVAKLLVVVSSTA